MNMLPRHTAIALSFLGFLACLHACRVAPEQARLSFDETTQQQPVSRHAQLDSVLAQLSTVPFALLDSGYLVQAGILGKWRKDLARKTWYAVEGDQGLLFVVGRMRIQDFMAHDPFVKTLDIEVQEADQPYFTIDKRVLHKLLDLLLWMQAQGYDTEQVRINYGFRHPSLNVRAGGAPKSRHQWGEAIDLLIGDIDRNGVMDAEDKLPLLEILETKIIGNNGGVGRYPGTQVIHIDVRGSKARWDHQK
jgi:Peptidase M15